MAEAIVPVNCTEIRCGLAWANSSAAAPRVCLRQSWAPDADVVIDLDQLVARTISITDASGAAVPFAQVAIAWTHDGGYGWRHRCVADAAGRVRLLTDDTNWTVVALSGTQFRITTLTAADPMRDVTIALESMPVARLQVRDANGQLAVGARVGKEYRLIQKGDRLRRRCAIQLLRAARSDRHGVLSVPLVAGGYQRVAIELDGSRLRKNQLLAGGKLREIVLY